MTTTATSRTDTAARLIEQYAVGILDLRDEFENADAGLLPAFDAAAAEYKLAEFEERLDKILRRRAA
jgi:hypothetical protein